jgi:hypothetical protein
MAQQISILKAGLTLLAQSMDNGSLDLHGMKEGKFDGLLDLDGINKGKLHGLLD